MAYRLAAIIGRMELNFPKRTRMNPNDMVVMIPWKSHFLGSVDIC